MVSDKKKQCQLQALLACRLRGLKSWSPPSSKQQLAVLKVGLSDSDSYTVLAVGQSSSLDSLMKNISPEPQSQIFYCNSHYSIYLDLIGDFIIFNLKAFHEQVLL